MNEMQIFNNPQFGEIRVVANENGEPMFVARDITEKLGYEWNGVQRIAHVPEEWKGVTSVVTPGGKQEMWVLSEQGLYFFLGRSDKPGAFPFQKWIAGEVLPSVRKHGAYITPDTVEKMLSDPDTTIKMLEVIKKEREEKERLLLQNQNQQKLIEASKQKVQILEGEKEHLAEENKLLAPRAEYTDTVLQSVNTYTSTQIAKELGLPSAMHLHKLLREKGVLFKQSGQWLLYSDYCGLGYTETRTHYRTDEQTGIVKTTTYTVWTELGRKFLHEIIKTEKAA